MTFPLQLVLDGAKCVVVGGGKVAARKVGALRRAGGQVHVVSPAFDDALLERDDITRHQQPYSRELLAGARVVMVCTDDRAVNAQVSDDARAVGALVNVADDPEFCDFYVPAVVRRGPIQIAVGTGGASPELAATVRRRIEAALPESFAELAEELRRLRPIVKDRIADQPARARLFAALCGDDSVERFESAGLDAWRGWAEGLVAKAAEDSDAA